MRWLRAAPDHTRMGPDKQTLDALRIDHSHAPRGGPSFALVVCILAIAATAAGFLWWFNQPKPAVVRTIVVAVSAPAATKTLLNASGYVKARREATVSSK